LIPRSIRNIAMFLSKNNLRDASYAYHYICKTKLEGLKKITASRYTKDTQALFDDFYQQFSSQHLKQESGDKKRKNDLQKLVACRCIEYYLEHDPKPKIPVLLPFDVRMDSDGRILLGYSRVQGKNSEIRPTLKHFSNCFVRFRPHIDGAYDAYKINDHGKIIDFVPALFLMAKSRLQHVAPGYAVAEYIKGYRPRPLSFRTYLTADSKIYFAKIDGEVIQTLTSYLSGGNAVECSIRKDEIGYFMDVYPIEPSTAKKILKKPVRSIMLRNEKPYFTDIADDFAPARFFEMPKNIFNSAIPLFKQRYFCAFYDGLTLEQKKELYEKLTSKGEEYLIEQIGHEKFADDLEQITFTYGDELANISELLGDKEEVEQREYVASYSRRETDIRGDEPEFADVDDDSFFARSEAERIDEFGFDFAAYPPELTFQIKMPILRKIFESFPREFRRYIKIHADDIDEEIQDKLVSINPRLLDGIPIERTFKVRKDPVKRAFIDELIRILEDKVSYDAINVIINYLRNATVRIRKNDRTGAFIVKKFVMSQVAELVSSESDLLYSAIELEIID
ncbi:hypothetical protein KDK77_04620, partial [bacterium]|nr:hypothetical protein [bacterium]